MRTVAMPCVSLKNELATADDEQRERRSRTASSDRRAVRRVENCRSGTGHHADRPKRDRHQCHGPEVRLQTDPAESDEIRGLQQRAFGNGR